MTYESVHNLCRFIERELMQPTSDHMLAFGFLLTYHRTGLSNNNHHIMKLKEKNGSFIYSKKPKKTEKKQRGKAKKKSTAVSPVPLPYYLSWVS